MERAFDRPLFESTVPLRGLALIVPDPRRGGTLSYVDVLLGGNPKLELVTARSFTTGFDFMPGWTPELRLHSNYWRVVMGNRIMAPTSREVLKPDSTLANRVVRGPPTEDDLRLGWVGSMRLIDLTPVNYGDLETSGIDLGASLLINRPWGRLKLELATTWVDEYLSRDMNPALPRSRVGIANMQGTIPEWRTIGTVGFEHGRFGVSTTTLYVPGYRDSDLQGAARQIYQRSDPRGFAGLGGPARKRPHRGLDPIKPLVSQTPACPLDTTSPKVS